MPNERPTLAAVITASIARMSAERGLSLDDVTRRAGLHPHALAPLDGQDLDLEALSAVASVLGVAPVELLYGG